MAKFPSIGFFRNFNKKVIPVSTVSETDDMRASIPTSIKGKTKPSQNLFISCLSCIILSNLSSKINPSDLLSEKSDVASVMGNTLPPSAALSPTDVEMDIVRLVVDTLSENSLPDEDEILTQSIADALKNLIINAENQGNIPPETPFCLSDKQSIEESLEFLSTMEPIIKSDVPIYVTALIYLGKYFTENPDDYLHKDNLQSLLIVAFRLADKHSDDYHHLTSEYLEGIREYGVPFPCSLKQLNNLESVFLKKLDWKLEYEPKVYEQMKADLLRGDIPQQLKTLSEENRETPAPHH
ncbi:MAG: hypothetical protein Q8R24_09030 [Legionellaceae bacterium]|nr:hypothetical protein [Legionellaceae bacterium]